MSQKLKSEKEVLQERSFLSILNKEKFSPEEERELIESAQKMVDGLNKSVS